MFIQNRVKIFLRKNIEESVKDLAFDHKIIIIKQLIRQHQESLDEPFWRDGEFRWQTVADNVQSHKNDFFVLRKTLDWLLKGLENESYIGFIG